MAGLHRARWYLRSWRKHRELTQDQLAERSGLSKPFISQLETGKRQYSQDVLELLAETLRCGPADLLMRDPSDPEGIWTVWEHARAAERAQIVKVAKVIIEATEPEPEAAPKEPKAPKDKVERPSSLKQRRAAAR